MGYKHDYLRVNTEEIIVDNRVWSTEHRKCHKIKIVYKSFESVK